MGKNEDAQGGKDQKNPNAFHVSGPRNVPSISWRDLLTSSWTDANYKRTVMACFIQAVYLLELDRQESRVNGAALAPKWWTPFKYKPTQTLIDERDGSIFGAVLEWDRAAAMADFVPIRPSGAPRAVLAFRGTLLKTPTLRRDIEDDLRFLAWESLEGSVRFSIGLKALRSICDKFGGGNVCLAGHSLGAGFALQVGKVMAKEGIIVEAHLFNPPSVSLKNMGERAGGAWRWVRSMLTVSGEIRAKAVGGDEGPGSTPAVGVKQWIPNLYVNNGDYICCYYSIGDGAEESGGGSGGGGGAGKVFVMSKGKQTFVEAHGLQQWWSDDLELQMAVNNSKLISRQLKSLYGLPPAEQSPGS